jgi:hypothetical protein
VTSNPEYLSPAAVDAAIAECVNDIAASVKIVSDAEAVASHERRLFDWAWAQATLHAEGSNAEARKAWVMIQTMSERAKAEIAEESYRFAQRRARALEKRLDGLRSQGVSIRTMYGSAGVGDR